MSYNENLADRIRESLLSQKNVEEKKMMGGLTFMVDDKMCVGILKDDLMARIDPEMHDAAIQKQGCRTMDFNGRPTRRPMFGYVLVSPEAVRSKKDLDYWVGLALDFNKKAKSSKSRKK